MSLWKPVLPHRALYICDQQCGPTCTGCFCQKDGVNWTEEVLHAKNGPVQDVREWETRFEIKQHGILLYYQEKIESKKEEKTNG